MSERKRKSESKRKSEKEGEKDFFKGKTGALAPFSYLVII